MSCNECAARKLHCKTQLCFSLWHPPEIVNHISDTYPGTASLSLEMNSRDISVGVEPEHSRSIHEGHVVDEVVVLLDLGAVRNRVALQGAKVRAK